MALVGNLKDLKLANLIQINCIERNTAKVSVRNSRKVGQMYFVDGAIIHAEIGPYIGERAVHEMLSITEGAFKVEAGIEAPAHTINRPWNSVVLEGLRLIDEKEIKTAALPKQLLAHIAEMEGVTQVFVLDAHGKVIEGKKHDGIHPAYFAYTWLKMHNLVELLGSTDYSYMLIRRGESFLFIFEFSPHIIFIETELRILRPQFVRHVHSLLQRMQGSKG